PVASAWLVAVTRRRHLALGILTGVLTVVLVTTTPGEGGGGGGSENDDDSSGSAEPSFTGHFVEDWRGAVELIRRREPEGRHAVFVWAGLIESADLGPPDDIAAENATADGAGQASRLPDRVSRQAGSLL